jgi:RimJ/RimL family protein N-acetyltransferase
MLPAEVLARIAALPVKPAPVTLTGERIVMRPYEATDQEALHAVSNGQPCELGARSQGAYDAGELIWKWMFGGPFPSAAALGESLGAFAAKPDVLTLTVCDRETSMPLGVASLMANQPAHLKIELGSIWYGPIAQGTGASREATQLMCAHAFGLGYRRVEWKCDARNERSRRAALSYGFTFEGIQQQHMIVRGDNRDTAWFRLLAEEWPRARH